MARSTIRQWFQNLRSLCRGVRRPSGTFFRRLRLEELEIRRVLSPVAWQNLNGGDWDTKANWSTDNLPGSGDDVTIPRLNNGASVTHSAGNDTVHSVTSAGNLTMSGGTLTANNGLAINSTAFNFTGGSIGGTVTLNNSALGLSATTAASFVLQGSDTLTGNVAAGQTLWVQGSNAGGTATLTTSGNVTNDGTILLQSINNNYTDILATGSGTFTNAADGTIQAAFGGTRTITGTLVNQGLVTVTNSALLTIQGNYYAAGGTISGPGYLINCNLYVTASPSAPTTILVGAKGDTLKTNVLPGTTVWVQGCDAFGDAVLTVPDGLSDDGTVLLQSINNNYAETLSLSGTFTNAADGTIQAAFGGTRTITGTLVNQGLVTVTNSALLTIQGNYNAAGGTISGPGYLINCNLFVTASPSAPTTILIGGANDTLETNNLANTTLWVQGNAAFNVTAVLTVADGLVNHGTVLLESINAGYTDILATGSGTFTNAADGTIQVSQGTGGGSRTITGTLVNQGQINVDGNTLLTITGKYYAAGGTISGPGYLTNSALYVTASASTATTILLGGGGNVLETNNLANTTLWVQGNAAFNTTAVLTVADGLVNHGTILLESINAGYTDILATGSGTFTNAADGTIQVTANSGGARSITGTLVNQGQINVDNNTLLTIQGTYNAAGGTISGPGYLINCNLFVTASPSAPTTILIGGANDTLETNNLANTTLWVQGNAAFNVTAVLTVADGLVNHGTVLLESINAGYTDILATGSGTFTNAADGTIQVSQGTGGGSRTITGTLVNQGQINVDGNTLLTITGKYYAAGGTISGPGYLTNSALYVTASASTATTILLGGGGNVLETNNLANTTLWVQGNAAFNTTAVLTVADGLVNHGTILLESINAGYTDILATGSGTFTNAADGTIQVTANSGGARSITGTLVNQGQINVDNNTLLTIQGTYNAAGGTISGPGYLVNATLLVTASTAAPTTLLIVGSGDTLATNNLANTTLWVQGDSTFGNASLTIDNGVNNAGTILLQSISAGYAETLAVASGGTFTNSADGTIQVNNGTGGPRSLTGNFTNLGAVIVGAGSDFTVNNISTAATFVNQGQVTVDPAGLMTVGQTYNAAGGVITGPGYVYNGTLDITTSTASPTTILVDGNTTLATNNLPNTTIWVQGNDVFGFNTNATLTVANGVANHGTILLQSLSFGYAETLAVAANGTFTNAADGTIQVNNGTGGPRSLTGNLTNLGAINVGASTDFTVNNISTAATFVNQGQVTVDPAGLMTVGQTYDAAGGTIAGPGYVYNGTLDITTSTASPTTILVDGNTTLATNNLPNTTIWVQGNDIFGFNTNATLTVANGEVNHGTILLQSLSLGYADTLALAGTFTNAADGTIQVNNGTGGPRTLTGSFTNLGAIDIGAGTDFTVNNTSTAATFVNQGQVTVDPAGLMTVGQTYNAAGGTITGPGYVYNGTLDITTSTTAPTTILVDGSTTLATNNLPNTTIWAEGNNLLGFNTNATLTVANGLANHGTILLQSLSLGYADTLALAGTFTNAADGTIQVNNGTGGPRYLTGNFTNLGAVNVGAGSDFTVNNISTTATFVNQGQVMVDPAGLMTVGQTYNAAGGTITGPGYVYNGTLDITASTGSPTTILVDGSTTLVTNNLPNTTIWAEGNNLLGFNTNATLTVANGLANHGTILLQSLSLGYADTLALAGTFTNSADGTIQVNNGTGGPRSLTGSFTNLGAVNVGAGADFAVNNTSTAATFVNQGQVTVDPAGLMTVGQTYNAAGGTISGPGYVYNGTLDVTASTGSPTTILVDGSTTLATNNLPNTTIWVQGNNVFGFNTNATLTVANGLANHGTILLQSLNLGYVDTLALAGTFTNGSDGTIQVSAGTGGSRSITGSVTNAGTINFDTNTSLGSAGANHINAGLISIGGATVTVTGSSFTNNVGGLVSGDGTFNTAGLSLTNQGIIDLARPSILGVDAELGFVTITYDDAGAMNAATVTNVANYKLLGSGGDGIFGNGNDVDQSSRISQVTYNAATKTATLQLSSQLPPDVYWVEVNGSNVLDAAGTALLAGQTDLVNRVVGVVSAQVAVKLDPASNSGAPNHLGYTNVTNPTFDVQVNQAGTIGVDFDGNGTTDATMVVQLPGTYQLTAPKLADGTYVATATLTPATGLAGQGSATYTIDTATPSVTSLSPTATVYNGVSQATVTFNEPIDLNTFSPTAITLTGPNGTIAVHQPQLVSGSTYSLSFAAQTVQGVYTLSIGTSVADFAGNPLKQAFTGSFTIALPDLAVTSTSAPPVAVEGASVPVSWTVTNQSATNPATSTWSDTVYLSTLATLDSTATALTSVAAPPQSPLAGNANYTRNVSVTIPANIGTGGYYLLFVANANGGQLESDTGNDTNDLAAVSITLLAPAQVSVSLDAASDSGAPDHPGFTNVTTPTFDVQVNQPGTITVDFDGIAAHDQTRTVSAAGMYQFTASTLANGAYTATATFAAGIAGTTQNSTSYTIDTVGAHVTSLSPTGTIHVSASQATITFSEPVDLNSFSPAVITFTGPNGVINVNQPQLTSGSTYTVSFATQITDGDYTLTIAPSVTDYAGNQLDQNQNGINGEATDSFTGSFTMSLPVGGSIALNVPTLGFVPANKVDDWTFYGRAGQAITTVVATADAENVPPLLNYAQVTLLDSSGDVLGTTSNSQSGGSALLGSITLPTDGTYDVRVQAPAAQPGITGFYDLTVADSTVHQTPLPINETVTGELEDPYSSDQWTFSAMANQAVQFNLVNVANPGIEFDLTGPNGYTAFSGATNSSGAIVLPTAGNYTVTVHTTGLPGAYAFALQQNAITDLTLNTPYQVPLAGSGQSQLFAVTVGAANPLEFKLTDANALDQNEIYVSYGSVPTRDSYGYRFTGGAAADQTVVLTAKPGTYYILVYNNLVRAPGSYTIEAESAPFLLSGMTPTEIGNGGNTTLQFTGVFPLQAAHGGYVLSTAPYVQLISANGTVYPGLALPLTPPPYGTVGGLTGGVNPDGTMTVSAVVPGGVVLPGTYSVRITDDSGYAQTLANALTVVQGGLGILKTNVIVPNPIGYHVASTIYVQYTNVGNAPLAAPLLVLTATQNGIAGALMTLDASKIVSGFWTSATPDDYGQSVQFLASGAVPGVLQPGESETVPVYYSGWVRSQWDFSRPPIDFSLGVLDTTNTQTVDWSSLQSSLQPASLSNAAWDALFPNLTAQLGPTWGSYVQQLDNDAQYLQSVGSSVTDIGQLFNFEVQQANGFSPLSSLASATDAQVAAPGLPLSFARTFAPGIIARNQVGIFGWGWSDSWETSLTVDSDGSVNVLGPDGSLRRFQPDSRGGYFAQAGDHGTLAALTGGGYTLTELNGEITAYNANGTLNYVEYADGNTITASYTNGLLTKLTHSSGQFLTLAYNAAGLVSTITDSAGRVTTFQYDASNQYLTSVVDFDGQTTTYTYDTGTNATTAHALLSVTHSDGSHDYFSYDSQGRLADAHRDGGADDTTFAYTEGQVAVSDALGDTTTYSFDNRGLLVQVENPLQNTVHYTYDSNLNLTETTDAAGQVYTNTYDSYGDLLTSTDPLGNTVSYTYDCTDDRLASVTDGDGNTTNYGYDGKGDLTSTTYADGTVESVAYDPVGNVLSSTDQMGQATTYTHDAAGNVLTETFADGSKVTFTYDKDENLTSATDATGTTTLTYDTNDQLIEILYPSGHYLKYSYDIAGRRTQMVDDTGFTVNYTYDNLGDLATLTDGSGNLIVRYTYDVVGQLSREDHGNGTYVSYKYDAAGELLSVVNYAPDGSVISFYDDTFDNLGRLINRVSPDGTWAYAYDAIGELTHAIYTSNNPDVPNQDLAYAYDAAGNRTQTVTNGVTTAYTTNDMNEYTQVGAAQYSYNADGDLVSITGASGTTNYAYNAKNQLVGETAPNGSWTYQYDVFGNKVSETDNGQTTQFVTDPTDLGNVVAAYDENGNVMADFTYGLALTSEVTPGGSNYYLYCSSGNTMGLTNPLGVQFQSYIYDPDGILLSETGSAYNPFTWGGQLGILSNADGTFSTSSGDYRPDIGRTENNPPQSQLPMLSDLFEDAEKTLELLRIDIPGPVGFVVNWVLGPINSFYQSERAREEGGYKLAFNVAGSVVGGVATGYGLYAKWLEVESALQYLTNELSFDASGLSTSTAVNQAARESVLLSGRAAFARAIASRVGVVGLILFFGEKISEDLYKLYTYTDAFAEAQCTAVNSTDPNAKTGPAGYGSQNFVSPASPLPYRVDFENAPTASAPAQRVDITDQLDPNLDWTSFQWTGFGFGDNVISIPANTQHYETTLPMTYNGVTFRVVIDLDLNPLTGMLHASFQSLNAANLMTGNALCPGTLSLGPTNPEAELPPSVLIGFLPPENGTGRGMGYLTYTVSAKPNLVTGTQIRNVADVTFDQGTTIATDQVSETDPTQGVDPTKQALVTIDSVAPISSVTALPAVSSVNAFTVSWSGMDDAGGSGIGSYTIYVSDNGGPFTAWLTATTLTSATYVGLDGHTYGFYSVATDNVGNVQGTPSAAQATTTVDAVPPNSSVKALPTFSPGSFTVGWSGSDANGIGIATYTIDVSDNGGAFTPWLTNTPLTSATYTGVNGHTYGFFSVATDMLGNQQPTPTAAQASTTVDTVAPTSSVNLLSAFSPATFTVGWSGSDNAGGSGLASYSIFVSDNGGAFTPLLSATTQTSTSFTGVNGHTYGFYSIATDNVGNVQPTPSSAQASTTVDTAPPTSSVNALPSFSPGSFILSWSGNDGSGSGIATYEVDVSDNGGAFTPLFTNTTQASTTFNGDNGHTYGFYSIATDNVGNRQATPTTAQAATTIDATPTVTVSGGPFTYDGTQHAATVTVTSSIPGDPAPRGTTVVTYVLGGYDSTTPPIHAGTYAVTAAFTSTDPAYVDGSGSGSITINPAILNYTIGNDSQPYGKPANLGADLGTTVAGVNGENLTIAYASTGDTASADVGGYAITGTLSNGTGLASDYQATLTPGTLTVKPYAFNYAIGNDSQTYGTPANLAADLPATISTGVNNQALDILYSSLGDNAAAHVGGYAITGTLSNGTGLASDYQATLTPGTLTVKPYAFNYAIGNDSQTYGTPANLAADLPATISTGVNNQALDILYSSLGDNAAASAGLYGISGLLSNGTGLAADYQVALTPGTLTVQPALSVVATKTVKALQNVSTGSTLLATFTAQTGLALSAGNFSVSIDWKDGGALDTTHYSVSVSGTTVQVFGTHTYTSGGSYNPAVTLTYTGAAGSSITAKPTVNVATNVTSSASLSHNAPLHVIAGQYSGLYLSTLTVKNTSSSAINGSLEIVLSGLAGGGASLSYATVTVAGTTYNLPITLDAAGDPVIFLSKSILSSLASGASLSVSLYFSESKAVTPAYTPLLFSDPFDS